jgi:hypothetical protein
MKLSRHSGARRSREPGIHNHEPGLWIPGLRRSGASRIDDGKCGSPMRYSDNVENLAFPGKAIGAGAEIL